MADRREFALLGFLVPVLLGIPALRLPAVRQRILIHWLIGMIVLSYSVFPFLLPGFNHRYLKNLKTSIDTDGVCIQSNNYCCGPAAAVTALRRLGVSAGEGELAALAHTTWMTGTQADSLGSAILSRYGSLGITCHHQIFESLEEVQELPVIALVKHSFLVDHYVALLRVEEEYVEIGDPLLGKVRLAHPDFLQRWRMSGLVLHRTSSQD